MLNRFWFLRVYVALWNSVLTLFHLHGVFLLPTEMNHRQEFLQHIPNRLLVYTIYCCYSVSYVADKRFFILKESALKDRHTGKEYLEVSWQLLTNTFSFIYSVHTKINFIVPVKVALLAIHSLKGSLKSLLVPVKCLDVIFILTSLQIDSSPGYILLWQERIWAPHDYLRHFISMEPLYHIKWMLPKTQSNI